MGKLFKEIRACRVCENHLPLGPRPIVQGHANARLLIVGQAPGLKVHKSGIPWNDASGERLRQWLALSSEIFYDPNRVAIIPVGFCYPGRAKSGDAPPRKECFELWHHRLGSYLTNIRTTLLIGNFAQTKYLENCVKINATETIRDWREYTPKFFPLPHPSPRNNIWLRNNPWFEETVVPEVRTVIKDLGLFASAPNVRLTPMVR